MKKAEEARPRAVARMNTRPIRWNQVCAVSVYANRLRINEGEIYLLKIY